MYKSFYDLTRDPFAIDYDSDFLWLGEKHKESLATLRYGILDNKGFLLLTGMAGTGKTTLVNAMTENFGSDVEWAIVSDPKLERIDFYNTIANGFGLQKQFTSKVQFLIQFSHFLHKADDEEKKVVLIVDECHLLSQEMLEELRLLSNIEKADTKLINIFFVGQPEFKNMLVQPENRAVRQRLTLKSEIKPLTANEAGDYIRHRLEVAGTQEKIFNVKAVQLINNYAQGVVKRIDVLCHHLLVAGAAKDKRVIDQKDVTACVQQLNLPANPVSEDFDNLNNSVSSQENSGQSSAVVDNETTIPSIPVEDANRKNFRGYALGLGVLLLLGVGMFFWLSQDKNEESSKAISAVKKEVVEPKPVPQKLPSVSSSPAVTVLKKNNNEIDKEKAAELKSAILKKAYNGNGVEEKKPVELAVQKEVKSSKEGSSELGGETATFTNKSSEAEKEVSVKTLEEKQRAVQSNTSEPEIKKQVASTSGGVANIAADTPKAIEKAEVVVKPELPPLEPRLVRLALMPNSLTLTHTAKRDLEAFVDKLKLYPRATILIKGFVSSKSNSPQNIKLSEDRANSVQELLRENGIDLEQIEVVGMGNKEPLASNDTRQGRTKNRRVEIKVISDGT